MSGFLEFTALRPDVARGLRTSLTFVVPLIVGHALGWGADSVLVAIAAQSIALPDLRGAYGMRLVILGTMIALATISAMAGVWASGSIVAATLAMGAMALLGAGWRHLSTDYGPPVSVASALLFLLGLAHPGPPSAAWHVGGLIALGGLGTALVSMAFWPFRPQHPLRYAVAESWGAVSDLAEKMRVQSGDHHERHVAAVSEAERELRATLDRTYVILSTARTRRFPAFLARMESMRRCAVQLAMRLSALHSSCEPLLGRAEFAGLQPVVDSVLKAVGDAARSVAVTLISRRGGNLALTEVRLKRCQHLLQVLDSQLAAQEQRGDWAHLRAAIPPFAPALERIRTVLRETADRENARVSFPAIPPEIGGRSIRSLAAWINPPSELDAALVRYSLRMAVLTMAAVVCWKVFHIPNGYWIAFTIVVVLQPDYGSTRQRAVERMGGTIAGSLLGSALLWVKMPVLLLYLCAGAMAYGFAYHLKRSYGVAVFFVTLMLVLVTETMMTVHLDFTITRLWSNLLGGAVALLAAFLFWPISEEKRFRALLAEALRMNAAYAEAIGTVIQNQPPTEIDLLMEKRRAENADRFAAASLQRLTTEPGGHHDNAASLATYNQRITRALTAMAVQVEGHGPTGDEDVPSLLKNVGAALQSLADNVESESREALLQDLAGTIAGIDGVLVGEHADSARGHPENQLFLAHLTKCVVEMRAIALALQGDGETFSAKAPRQQAIKA